jgi:hypothetical protein
MERVKFGLTSGVSKLFGAIFSAVIPFVFVATAPAQPTNLAVTVRHAPSLNGNGLIEGSLQQLLGENATLNGGFTMTGDLLLPGTPSLRVNGNPTFAGTIAGTGGTSPTGYQITLNGNCSLRYLRTRTMSGSLPTVTAPPQPSGTRSVTINSLGQSIGDPATLRDLTLNGNVGQVTVPPGTYGTFTANGGSGLVLGVAGGLQAVNYNLQNLNLNGNSTLKVVGPVVLTVANGFTANGTVGASNNPAWLQLQVASGVFTLNGGCTVYGLVLAPNGTVIVNGNSTLVGTSASDQFILNGGGVVRWGGSPTLTNQPPVATPQSITLAENSSTNITLTGSDSQGKTLTFSLLTLPTHGTVSGTPPSVTYKPATNYIGSDAFTFKVNNGITDSSPATVSLTVTQVYYPPTAFSQSLTNFEDTALPVTLTGYDPQGYALTFSVLTQPAHGTLSGTAPNLTYKPATNYFGNDSFTFRVGDGVSNSPSATISITNRPVDDPPVVVAGPNQLIILPANSVNLAGAVAYDVFPGTVDTIVWSNVSGPGNVTFSNPSNTLTTATFSQPGIYRLCLFASDSFLSGSNDLFVTVDAPPVVNAGQTMTNTFPGTIILPGSASDDGLPTNGTMTVVWSKISGLGTVVFGDAAATNSTATFSTNGVYGLRLTADDSIATNHSDVTVIENLPPVVNAGASILTNGLKATLNGSVNDDGLPGGFLSMQWSQAGGPGTITFGNTSATNTTVTASQSGTYVLVLAAYDGAATNSGEVVVTFNLPPVVNAGPTQTVNFGTTVMLAGTVTDDQLPHNILTSTWTEVSGPGNATFANASLTNTTVTFDQPGKYILRLTASDTLATTTADVVIRVNAAPVVNAGTNQIITWPASQVVLQGTATDDGMPVGSSLTTSWSKANGPGTVVFANASSINTTATFGTNGVYILKLAASDGVSTNSSNVTVIVNQAPSVSVTADKFTVEMPDSVTLTGIVYDDGLPNGTLTCLWNQVGGSGAATFSNPAGTNTTVSFNAAGTYIIKGDARAELTWFAASRTQLKLCWQVLFTSQWRDEMYLTLVAADTGEILYRRNLTTESSAITCRVYTNASPTPLLPGWSTPNTAQPAPVERGLVTFTALDDAASPNGWIADGDNETRGNNVDAHLDRNDDNLADLPRPTGNPSRVFDFPLDLTTAPANYGEAATVQLFYWDNWMHDALYQLGFTEAAGNFQTDNFGRGGLGNDAVQADAQDGLGLNDGRHANNANMSTPPDGCAPRMQMYVFDGASPARDGALDAQIVLHEYTHGLSTRLVGGGAGIDALQTAGMGEGWSDFYALALLTDPAADVDGVYPMASYVAYHGFGTTFDQNYYYGIRRYPYCTDTNKNPLTFADIDPGKASAHDGVPRNPLLGPFRADLANEVHSQGEVWCMMLWEMRANLINKLGPEAGNNVALQLVTDGLKLSPPNPNFVQARDAILLADRMWSGGTNAAEIWSAFAKRGLGFNAKAPESYTTAGAQESHDLMPALATERVEIQGGSGSVELGVNNNLLIHLRNQGDTAATHVSGRLATAIPGVAVLQNLSTYSDIPQGGSRANDAVFQIQTGTGFMEGTPIDLAFVITSDQSAGTNYLRLFTGVPGAEILFDNYSALADPATDSSVTKDLTPMDLGNLEPLWMADDASCLLKAGAGKYVLWKPDGTSLPIVNANFLAHRLTRNGVVVGTMTLTNTFDELNNKIPHSVGAWWFFLLHQPVPLTRDEYRWPTNAAPLSPAGKAYSLTNLINGQPQFLTNVTRYPELQDVWDQNSSGMAVGSVSVQEPFSWQQVLFGADGTMNWFRPSERGLDAGPGINSVTELRYYALLSTAAQFNNINDWRWLGPLSWGYSTAIALLVNDAGMIAGYGGVYAGNPTFDALRPTHAFRAPASGEFDGSAIILTNDLGVLPGGLHSFPRAMNQAGELVGYSDFDVMNTGGLTYDPLNSHAVFWGLTNQTPEYLTNLPPSAKAPYGYGDAYAINDSNQIVGASMTVDGRLAAVMWQLNHNTNSAPFWEITDLNDRLTDPSLQVFRAVGINNDSLILAYAQNAAGENHAVLLIPMAMAVDNNRDGRITFDAADQATADKPYHFWINDSQEGGDEVFVAEDQIPGNYPWEGGGGGGEYPPPIPIPNHEKNQVNGRSDLVNFFPVALRLGNNLHLLSPTNGFEYHLVQDYSAVKFVYTGLTLTNAFDYLTNTASTGYGANFDKAVTNADTIRAGTAPGAVLDTNWLAQVQKNGGTGVILVEGCATNTRPLMLEIWRNGKLLVGTPLSLSISGVEQMFRHLNFCSAANGSVEVAPRATAPNEPETNDKNFVFLHGYNVNQQEARGVLSEVFKRMYWSGSKAKFYGVTWNGAVTKDYAIIQALPQNKRFTPDYHTNVYNAFLTAPHFADFLGSLSGETVVAAHSLGNMVVLSALNDCTNVNLKVNTYFMIDAAVAMEAVQSMAYDPAMIYSKWRSYSNRLFTSDWWQLFPADDVRSTLTWNNRLADFRNTDTYNFYSSGEEVLRNYNVDPPAGVLRGTATEIVENWAGHPYGSYVWVWHPNP